LWFLIGQDYGEPSLTASLDYDDFDATFDLSIYLDPRIPYLGEMQYAVILIDLVSEFVIATAERPFSVRYWLIPSASFFSLSLKGDC